MSKLTEQDSVISPRQALAQAVQIHGTAASLGRALNKPRQVTQWLTRDGQCPYSVAADIERLTGVPKWLLRPDVYDPPAARKAAAE